jgi:hypothetical protein
VAGLFQLKHRGLAKFDWIFTFTGAAHNLVPLPVAGGRVGSDRRYFDYLSASNGSSELIKRVKAWILDEYYKGDETK